MSIDRGPEPTEVPGRRIPPHLRAKVDPEDIAQEVGLRAHRARFKLGQMCEAERLSYLRRTFKSALSDEVRKFDRTKRHVARERSLSCGPDGASAFPEDWLVADHTSPTGRARRAELLARLATALAGLPEDQRRAVELHHYNGCSLKDTAAAMGRSEHSVAGLIRRGLVALRGQLGEGP
ncbi:MAG: sigma-70 family RNA polymerase sigma factor [Isosphaeraceae bacterium]